MVIQCMIEGRPFLYQAKDETVYHVNEKGVQAIQTWSSREEIVAFVDGDNEGHGPSYMLRRQSVQIVLASPPNGVNQPWIKRNGCVMMLATKLWSARELFLAGLSWGYFIQRPTDAFL